jgi:uncharacterized protein (TIGR00299 family) protein
MILGALVDAGLPLEKLQRELRKLPLSGFHLTAQGVQRGGVAATKVNVLVEEEQEHHRHLSDILGILERSRVSTTVKERASAVFHRLAEAEARRHRTTPEEVHFHEVGAVDSIVDVVGAVVGLELLKVEQVYCSPLPAGLGQTTSQHGAIPLPAPGTLELLKMATAPLRSVPYPAELVTPTGAAVLTTLAVFSTPTIKVEQIGYGAGTREFPDLPNVLCVWLGEVAGQARERELLLLETNIDDMTPEMLAYVQERALALGARDAWFTPIQMKKGRPATLLSLLASPEEQEHLVDLLFRETSTLGLRVQQVRRLEVEREVVAFRSSLGLVQVKLKKLQGRTVGAAPEYEACKGLAQKRGMPLQEVYRIVASEAQARFLSGTPLKRGQKS